MGEETNSGGKSRFERFKDRADLSITSVSLVVSIVFSGVSIYQAGRAGAAADEANEIAAELGAIDVQREGSAQVPRVLISDGGNSGGDGQGADGYSQGTGWNPSQYPALILGADLEFHYQNVEGDNENSNAALERTTMESCVLQVWSGSGDGTAASVSAPCTDPVSVGPGEVLWVSAGIPDDQKRMFCARHPEGVAGFSIEVQHALYNVSNDFNDTPSPSSVNLVCRGRTFPAG